LVVVGLGVLWVLVVGWGGRDSGDR
jgi:hypothetical protein